MTGIAHALLSRVLDGRQAWYEHKSSYLSRDPVATFIELSLNIPGWPKDEPWTESVFAEGCRHISERTSARLLTRLHTDAGRFALFRCHMHPNQAKRRVVALERHHPWGRLWDIDCRGARGSMTRRMLGLPERLCLACDRSHETCIGTGRHSIDLVRQRAHAIAARPLTNAYRRNL